MLTQSNDVQLTSELEELQQLLFQQKQQVASLTAQNSLLQSEVDTGKSRLQSEAEKSSFAQDQLAAERTLRLQKAEQVNLVKSRLQLVNLVNMKGNLVKLRLSWTCSPTPRSLTLLELHLHSMQLSSPFTTGIHFVLQRFGKQSLTPAVETLRSVHSQRQQQAMYVPGQVAVIDSMSGL